MKYLIIFILSILYLSPCQSINDTEYLQTSKMVIDSFYRMYEMINEPKPKVEFANRRSNDRFVDYKEYLLKRFEPDRKTYQIRPFESLNHDELKLIEYLTNKFSQGTSTRVYYYKLVNYWLLPHFLSHQINIPDISEENKSIAEHAIQFETAFDQRCFIFLIESGFIHEFNDFYGLMNTIQSTIDLPGINDLYDLYEIGVDVRESFKDLLSKSATMIRAMDSFIGNEASLSIYKSEQGYLDNSRRIIKIFKEQYDSVFQKNINVGFQQNEYVKAPVHMDCERGIVDVTIRAYSDLEDTEIQFLNSVASVYSNQLSSEELYYDIVNYWILPVVLCHLLPESAKICQSDLEAIYNVQIINSYALIFLNDNKLLNKHKDFNRLINIVRSACKQYATKEELASPLSYKKNIINNFYGHATIMIEAIERMQAKANRSKSN